MSNCKFRFYLLFICVLLLASGCASTLRVGSISPDINIGNPDKSANNTSVAFEPFKISSKDQKEYIIGEAKVGAFNSKADIVSDEYVSGIVERAVKKGFHIAGFNLVALKDADFTIAGGVEKFWVDEYATGLSFEYSKASVRYDLFIKNKQGATVWANTLDAFKTSDKSMDTTGNDIPTLSAALKESVEAIFKDKTFWEALTK
jgi:hypothetical protein